MELPEIPHEACPVLVLPLVFFFNQHVIIVCI